VVAAIEQGLGCPSLAGCSRNIYAQVPKALLAAQVCDWAQIGALEFKAPRSVPYFKAFWTSRFLSLSVNVAVRIYAR
jgi:hypothetical protein